MKLAGAVFRALARATSKPDEEIPENAFTGEVHVQNRGAITILEAADGDVAARYELDEDTTIAGCLRRVDAKRLGSKEEVHVDTQIRSGHRVHEITDPFGLRLERDDGKGDRLKSPYPDLDVLVWSKEPVKQVPLFVADPGLLRRALAIMEDVGVREVLFFVPAAGREEDPVFLRGVTRGGKTIKVAVRRGAPFGRREKAAPVTEPTGEAPLFSDEALQGIADATGATISVNGWEAVAPKRGRKKRARADLDEDE